MRRRSLLVGTVAASLAMIAAAPAVAAPPATAPAVAIAPEPLYNGRANVHPNLLLNLSVEFPTVGIAYRGDSGTYNRTREYVGYFNPAKCYVYEGGERNLGDDAYFRIHKDAHAQTRECGGDSFSGNFMNWASSSSIDMLRYALTGGDRVIDKPGFTVLQRAMLRDAAGGNFYAHSTYFPRRSVSAGGHTSAPNQVTPFSVSTLYVVSCRNRILFSDLKSDVAGGSKKASEYCVSEYDGKGTPPDGARDKKLGEYLVRVRVCDDNEGPQRGDLCMKYGDHYKPVGELQRNASRVRVGAMAYLLDDAATRYGGVLRAPIKYLGATRFDAPQFAASVNDRPEWDAQTGALYTNPDDAKNRNSTSANSGVINYLNKFGRSAHYKTYDPVGELYYESLRYLQGKQPTPDAAKDATDAMREGFPLIDSWSDPVTASCQRNFILTIADVNTHWDRHIPGNQRTTYGASQNAFDAQRAVEAAVEGKTPALDVKVWTRKVGEMEVDASAKYGNPAPNASLANLDTSDTGSSGHGSYYMAGLAYWANTNDIRLDKPIRVQSFSIDVDEGGNGEIDTNTRALKPRNSQLYLAAKYGGFDDRNADGNPFVTFDSDGATVLSGTNKEWDNGAGLPSNYFLAGQPLEMISSIRRVFANISTGSGTLSGVGLSSSRLLDEGTHVYQPGFDPSHWSGSLRKLAISLNAQEGIRIAGKAEWDAGEILTGKAGRAPDPLPVKRQIFTATPAKTGFETVEFLWDQLSSGQQKALNASPITGLADGAGAARLGYLRGERDLEFGRPDGRFRPRTSVLGDIVNSNPIHVGAPKPRPFGADYGAFLEKHRKRTPVVYVGANDGMLHAFDAGNGSELFAYVPATLISSLPQLTRPDYVHRPYVDGGLAAAEALVAGKWKTVLAGAFGGGAQGVFALDITDPSDFAGGQGVLFEFTDANDPDMGHVVGAPAIALFHTGTEKGVPQYAHFVVVASGLNNYVADGEGRHNDDAAGALFLISLDKPADEDWEEGKNYYKFRLPAADRDAANGLSQPALVVGSDGVVRHAYMGDLQGNLWRLDFQGDAPWDGAAGDTKPLFVAHDAKDVRQPISTKPRVVFAPGGYLVLFGTGKFIEHADAAPANFSMQSFYAVHDAPGFRKIVTRAELAQRVAKPTDTGAYAVEGGTFHYGSGGKQGWVLDFPDSDTSGERVVTDAVVLDGSIFFNTLIPGSDPCASGGGRSFALATLSGIPASGITGFVSEVGLMSMPLVLELGTSIGARDAIGARGVQRRRGVVNFGTGGSKGMASPAKEGDTVVSLRAGRLSWREILNWQELRNAWTKK